MSEDPLEEPTDQEIIDKLIAQGYQIEMLDANGENFYDRYMVYKNMPSFGNRIVIIDANGNIVDMP